MNLFDIHFMNTNTPKTDELSAKLWNESPSGSLSPRSLVIHGALADFARELEREIERLRGMIQEYESALEDGPENLSYTRYEELSEKAQHILSNVPHHLPRKAGGFDADGKGNL